MFIAPKWLIIDATKPNIEDFTMKITEYFGTIDAKSLTKASNLATAGVKTRKITNVSASVYRFGNDIIHVMAHNSHYPFCVVAEDAINEQIHFMFSDSDISEQVIDILTKADSE